MTMAKFHTDVKRGKVGEKKVLEYLLRCRNVESVFDMSKDEDYQKVDIDFLVKKTDGTTFTIEVKTDNYLTDNFVYEKISNKHINSLGCFEKTKADYIFYYFIRKNLLYMFKTEKLREFVRVRAERGQFQLIPMGDNALGYKIPRSSMTPYVDYISCISL